MHEGHEICLRALGRTTIQTNSPGGTNHSQADEPLRHFSNMPVYRLMADVLDFRRLVGQLDDEDSSGKFELDRSPECISQSPFQISGLTSSTTTEHSSADSPTYTRAPSCISWRNKKSMVLRQPHFAPSRNRMLLLLFDAASHIVKGYRRALPLSNSGWSMRMFTYNACIVRQRPAHTIALGLEREQHSMRIRVDIIASRIPCSYLQRYDAR